MSSAVRPRSDLPTGRVAAPAGGAPWRPGLRDAAVGVLAPVGAGALLWLAGHWPAAALPEALWQLHVAQPLLFVLDAVPLGTWLLGRWVRARQALWERENAELEAHVDARTAELRAALSDVRRHAAAQEEAQTALRRKSTVLEASVAALETSHASLEALNAELSAQRDRLEQQSRERQQLVTAVATVPDGIGVTSAAGELEYLNAAHARIHAAARPEQLVGQPWRTLYPADEADRLTVEVLPLVERAGQWTGEVTGLRADGSLFPQELSLAQLPFGGLVFVVRDVSERQVQSAELAQLLLHDDVTGTLNRRGFLQHGRDRLLLARRGRTPCVLLYGVVPPPPGAPARDAPPAEPEAATLRAVAHVLRVTVRETDPVAYLGAGAFAVLLANARVADLDALMRRLHATLASTSIDAAPGVAALHTVLVPWEPATGPRIAVLLEEGVRALSEAAAPAA